MAAPDVVWKKRTGSQTSRRDPWWRSPSRRLVGFLALSAFYFLLGGGGRGNHTRLAFISRRSILRKFWIFASHALFGLNTHW